MAPHADTTWPRGLRPAIRVVTGAELAVAGAAVVLIFFLVFVQALQRYLPVSGWPWTGELARFSLVWLTFTVAGVLVTSDSHISLQLVDSVPNRVVTRFVRTFACLVVAAVGAAFAAECQSLIGTQQILKSPALQMPMSWLYVLPFVGFCSTTVRALVAAALFAVRGAPDGPAAGSGLETDDREGAPAA